MFPIWAIFDNVEWQVLRLASLFFLDDQSGQVYASLQPLYGLGDVQMHFSVVFNRPNCVELLQVVAVNRQLVEVLTLAEQERESDQVE